MKDYRDRGLRADERESALRWYYFPFGTKKIAWDRIVEVREHDMGTGITGVTALTEPYEDSSERVPSVRSIPA